jgi:hypothetical protein
LSDGRERQSLDPVADASIVVSYSAIPLFRYSAVPIMTIDPNNPVVALCAAGMAVDGDADAARQLFEEAWALRCDDYDACIAAHFLARHQPTPESRLEWNGLAARHAEALTDERAREFKASLYLNLADAHLAVGNRGEAEEAVDRAQANLAALPEDGYRTFIESGIARLLFRLHAGRRSRCNRTTP